MLLWYTMATLDGNVCADNSAQGGWGGAIASWRSAFQIQNNIITRNASSISAGGVGVMYRPFVSTEQVIVNNTFFDNHAVYGGACGVGGSGATVILLNNILWADTAQYGKEIYVDVGASSQVHYCDIQGGWPSGEGNIDSDPLFVPGDPAFNLMGDSPCIGRGVDSLLIGGTWYSSPGIDYDGHARPRPLGQPGDIGAQEDQIVSGLGEQELLPNAFQLYQNYPNPFNPSTTITYELPSSAMVRLSVFDLLGREVSVLVNERMNAGVHVAMFEATGLSSGVYFCRLQVGSIVQTRRLLLLR